MTDTLRWGILSTARINRRIIPSLKRADRSRVVAVASRSLEQAQEFAHTWEIPHAFGSYEAMLASPEIDTIYIPLPNSMHYEWAIKAAQAGKHVLCEKPLGLTVQEVDEMTQAAQANKVVLLEAFMYQMHPQLAKLKAVIQEGLIGQVKLVAACFSFTLPEEADNIRLKKDMGGGSVWDLGCYLVSFANTMADGVPQSVYGTQQLDANGVEIMFAGQLNYAGGMVAQINCGFRLPYRVGAEVVGDQGRIRIDQPWQMDVDGKPSGLTHIAPDDTETAIYTEPIDPYLCQAQVMERAILDGEPAPYTLTHSRLNAATINALYDSAARGEVVQLAG